MARPACSFVVSFVLAAALLLASSPCSAAAARQLLTTSQGAPAAAPSQPFRSPFTVPTTAATLRSLSTTMAAMANALQNHEGLQRAALACAEATGLPVIASKVPQVLVDAAVAFETNKFCALSTQAEQLERLSYLAAQAVSVHLKAVLLSDFQCTGMQAMPVSCQGIAAEVDDAIAAAVDASYPNNSLFCSKQPSSNVAQRQVSVVSLPADWEPAGTPAFSCQPRTPPLKA